jgi:hypothetical protein
VVGNSLIRFAALMALEEGQALLWSGTDGHEPNVLQYDLQVGCTEPGGLATPSHARVDC